jgi:tetratricopeptide (TPR) repeat protein
VHLERALALLDSSDPPVPDAARRRLALLTMLGACLQAHEEYTAPRTARVYEEIRRLCGVVGPTVETAQALGGLITFDALRARHAAALRGVDELSRVAAQLGLPALDAVAQMQAGLSLLMTGRLVAADTALRRALEGYDPERDGWLLSAVGQDIGVTARSWWAVVLWHLGRTDEAVAAASAAIAAARSLGHPFTLVFALAIGGCLLANLADRPDDARAAADEVERLATSEGLPFYLGAAWVHRGRARGVLGDRAAGAEELARGIAQWRELGTDAFTTWAGTSQAELALLDGRLAEAERFLDEVRTRIVSGEERIAELRERQLRGTLFALQGRFESARAALVSAIDLAEEWGAEGPASQARADLARLDDAESVPWRADP